MKISRSTFDKVMFPCYNPMSMVIKKAHGVNVYDTEGNKYIDLTSGIAVNCLGHTPRGVQKVIKKVSSKLIHCSNIFCNEFTLTLASKLVKLTGYEKVFFVNSGAEANEAALKLARRVAYDVYDRVKAMEEIGKKVSRKEMTLAEANNKYFDFFDEACATEWAMMWLSDPNNRKIAKHFEKKFFALFNS